jgi:hypothetical protein
MARELCLFTSFDQANRSSSDPRCSVTGEEVRIRGPALDDSHIRIVPQYLKICEENVAAVVVLWALQYCAIVGGQGDTIWLTVTEAELHKRLCGTFSIPTIRAARRYLIQRGILHAARSACNSIKVRFNWDVLTALVDELAPPQVPLTGRLSVRKKLRTSQEEPAKQSESICGLSLRWTPEFGQFLASA